MSLPDTLRGTDRYMTKLTAAFCYLLERAYIGSWRGYLCILRDTVATVLECSNSSHKLCIFCWDVL